MLEKLYCVVFIFLTGLMLGCSKDMQIPTVESITHSAFAIFFEPPRQASVQLLAAAKNGELGLVEDLADVNYEYSNDGLFTYVDFKDENGWTPLLWAVHFNHLDVAEALLIQDADAGYRASDGTTPIGLAVKNNSNEMIELLLNWTIDVDIVDSTGTTPLSHAIRLGNLEIADELVGAGASLHIRNHDGLSAMDYIRAAEDPSAYFLVRREAKEWRYLDENDSFYYEYRPVHRFRSPEQIRVVWIRSTPRGDSRQTSDSGEKDPEVEQTVTPEVFLLEAACERIELRITRRLIGGDEEVDEDAQWHRAYPGTIGEVWYEAACGAA